MKIYSSLDISAGMAPVQLEVGKQLKAIRNAHKYSQEEMAKIIGYNRSTYTYHELGQNMPSINEVIKFANYFLLPLEEIIFGQTASTQVSQVLFPPFTMQHTGKRIREIRKLHKLNQEEVARVFEITRSGYARIELTFNRISLDKLVRLSRLYQVPLGYFFVEEECTVHQREEDSEILGSTTSRNTEDGERSFDSAFAE